MLIEKFKKDKSNTYKLYFDDDTVISLYDDVIVKYNLLVNREMDLKRFDEITNYNTFLDGYYKSIKYINKRLRSEKEIEVFLKKLNIKNNDIKKIIKMLYKDGYLNNENYVKAYINDKYNLSNDGPNKIIKELVNLGYDINDFSEYLFSLNWSEKLNKIIDKKIKITHNLSNTMLKNKLLNDLIKLGYEKNDIICILDMKQLGDDTDILKKEYIKIKNKYSKKYKNEELDYKINKYLYSKGFNIDDIKMVMYENKI